MPSYSLSQPITDDSCRKPWVTILSFCVAFLCVQLNLLSVVVYNRRVIGILVVYITGFECLAFRVCLLAPDLRAFPS